MWSSPFLSVPSKVFYTLLGLGVVGALLLTAPRYVAIQSRALTLEEMDEDVVTFLEERAQRDVVRILLGMFTLVLIFWSFIVLLATEPWVDIIEFFDRPPPNRSVSGDVPQSLMKALAIFTDISS